MRLVAYFMTRILLVEPDSARREGLRSRLEDNGFTVVETPDLTDIAEFDPANLHAVISNAVLPTRAGVDLLSIIGRLPLILIAEHGSIPQAVAAVKLGARDYLAQPLDPDQLIASIEQLIDQDATLHAEVLSELPRRLSGVYLYDSHQIPRVPKCLVRIRQASGSRISLSSLPFARLLSAPALL